MSFKTFLTESLLVEGGAAIKGTTGVPQSVAKQLLPKLTAMVAKELGIKEEKVKAIGSAGHKPDDQLSGDLDIAIETDDIESIKALIARLGYNGQSKAMAGINVYSFAYKHKGDIYQVDLMPVPSLKFAEWSFHADEGDLAKGLKSAHRNELLFALAHHVNMKTSGADDNGEPTERTRYILDLSKGLFNATQSRMGKRGKVLKGFSTIGKDLVTNDPDEVVSRLVGPKFKASDLLTFDSLYDAIMSKDFVFPEKREAIINSALKGITKKELTIPDQLSS
jgi:hypothetical protein